ncbi:hypothetical protein HPB47_025390 [Ixodes persulcatus]|uniref:Uncharacterized protein n=1 Tax=Ixodes persulcatus TaxID=34615 RepID=A0AC60Q3F1_IXOPE|nr:hypothetical protein HPB47_025390 [Ixodes persulcatus]
MPHPSQGKQPQRPQPLECVPSCGAPSKVRVALFKEQLPKGRQPQRLQPLECVPSCGATSQVRAALHRHLLPQLVQDRLQQQQQLLITMMNPKERYATLMIDEMQLTPSLVYDASSGTVLGRPTLALADGTVPHHCRATHGLVYDVVKDNMSPTNEVKIEYAKQLVELDSTTELKIAAHLKQSLVNPGHY